MSARGMALGLLGVAAAGVLAAAVALGAAGGRAHPAAPGAFSWLKPARAPAGWHVASAATGAALAYPPGWRPIAGDPGTASAALLGPRGSIDGYLNATPRSGGETAENWSGFRPAHNLEEGDRRVSVTAAGAALRFRSGPGSCVIDSYLTSKTSYREIACIVSGGRSSTVVVAAAPLALWSSQAATLERAVSSFSA